jgi:ferrous iron transport protein A
MAETLQIAFGARFLASMVPGERGRVTLVRGPTSVRHRLMEMGLTPGTDVRMIRAAPLGDPIEIQLRSYRLSLRRSEAADIEIEAG